MQIGLASASSSTEFHPLDTGPFRYMVHVPWLYWTFLYMYEGVTLPWLYWTFVYMYEGVTYTCIHIQVNALKLKRDTGIVGSKFGYLYA